MAKTKKNTQKGILDRAISLLRRDPPPYFIRSLHDGNGNDDDDDDDDDVDASLKDARSRWQWSSSTSSGWSSSSHME